MFRVREKTSQDAIRFEVKKGKDGRQQVALGNAFESDMNSDGSHAFVSTDNCCKRYSARMGKWSDRETQGTGESSSYKNHPLQANCVTRI